MKTFPFLSILLTGWVLFATVQLLMPGLGDNWVSEAYAPEGWVASERWTYLLVEVVPLVIFVITGIVFYLMGAKTRDNRATGAAIDK